MEDRVPPQQCLYIVSDATGNSAEQMARSALFQFHGDPPPIRVWPRIRSVSDIQHVVRHATKQNALIIHTLVTPEHVEALEREAKNLGVLCMDLMGPLLSHLSVYLEQTPRGRPGRHPKLNAAYFRRMEAVEFTVHADDGRSADRLQEADLVLVGTSRSSKTPVAAYLAGHGYKVANIPLIHDVALPSQLFSLPKGKVFALTIDADLLTEIRASRMSQLGVKTSGDYADYDHVVDELRWANELFRQNGWPVINVSRLAVEETASKILWFHQRFIGTDTRDE